MKEARWEKKSISTEKHAPCGSSHRPPPSNPGELSFHLFLWKNSTNRLHEMANSSWEREGGLGDELGDAARQNELYCFGR